MIAYKLVRKLKDGNLTPLFINKTQRLPLNEWLKAEKGHHTKGYKYRPFWHCTAKPEAPHLSTKGRVWVEIEIRDYEKFERPKHQGGMWYLAEEIRINKEI